MVNTTMLIDIYSLIILKHPHKGEVMFGLGIGELALILGITVLFFGSKKIPELAKGIGLGINSFKAGLNEGTDKNKDSKDL